MFIATGKSFQSPHSRQPTLRQPAGKSRYNTSYSLLFTRRVMGSHKASKWHRPPRATVIFAGTLCKVARCWSSQAEIDFAHKPGRSLKRGHGA